MTQLFSCWKLIIESFHPLVSLFFCLCFTGSAEHSHWQYIFTATERSHNKINQQAHWSNWKSCRERWSTIPIDIWNYCRNWVKRRKVFASFDSHQMNLICLIVLHLNINFLHNLFSTWNLMLIPLTFTTNQAENVTNF